jgi:hypothetical protein
MGSMVAGQETAADGAIRAAGLINAMQGFSHYRNLSQEGVIASKPDLVVISADGVKSMGGEENLWKLPGLAQTPAGRSKQLLIVDDIALLGFGVRTPQALKALRESGAIAVMRPVTRYLWGLMALLAGLTLMASTVGRCSSRLPASGTAVMKRCARFG